MTSSTSLLLPVSPRIIPFDFGSSPLYSGQSVQVTCLVSEGDSPLEVFWNFNGSSKGVSTHKLGSKGSSLLIDDVDFEHRGNYTCYAKNIAGIISYSATLNVFGKFLIQMHVVWLNWFLCLQAFTTIHTVICL